MKPSIADMVANVLDLVNIQVKCRNVSAGTRRGEEGSTRALLLPDEMKTKCFAMIQHGHCVFFLPTDS